MVLSFFLIPKCKIQELSLDNLIAYIPFYQTSPLRSRKQKKWFDVVIVSSAQSIDVMLARLTN